MEGDPAGYHFIKELEQLYAEGCELQRNRIGIRVGFEGLEDRLRTDGKQHGSLKQLDLCAKALKQGGLGNPKLVCNELRGNGGSLFGEALPSHF